MPPRIVLHLAAILIAALLSIVLFQVWRAEQRDRDALQAELNATKQLLSAADSRQRDRDSQLVQTLASLAAEKRTVTTPAQILKALPDTLPLPVPIALQTGSSSVRATLRSPAADAGTAPTGEASHTPTNGTSRAPAAPSSSVGATLGSPAEGAFVPAQDLKPLYDFALDCKACQAKLAASQADLTDEKTKTAALTKERDDAVRVARGGSVLRRIVRAAKWFAIGAAAGAIAAKTAH